MLRINCSTRAYGETGSAESTTRGALATLATDGPTDQGHDLMANIVFPRPIGDLYVSSPTNQVQKYKQPTAADCLTAGVPCQGPKWGTSYVSSRNKSSPKTQNATNKTKHKTPGDSSVSSPQPQRGDSSVSSPQLKKKKKNLAAQMNICGSKGALFGNAQTRGFLPPRTRWFLLPPTSLSCENKQTPGFTLAPRTIPFFRNG